jgi:two-component system LytT family sensor kinase
MNRADSGEATQLNRSLLLASLWFVVGCAITLAQLSGWERRFFTSLPAMLSRDPLHLGTWMLYTWIEWSLLAPLIVWWVAGVTRRGSAVQRGAGIVAGALVFPACHLMLYLAAHALLSDGTALWEVARARLARHYIFGPIIYGTSVAALFLIDNYRRARDRKVAAARLEQELTRAELHLLQSNAQPQLLLEQLEIISELISRDPAAAERALARLSDLLRLVVSRIDDREALVEEDVRFAEVWIDLLNQTRRAPIVFLAAVPEEAGEVLVPNFLIQQFLHHCVVPNLASEGLTTLSLRILVEKETVRIELRHAGPARAAVELPPILERARQLDPLCRFIRTNAQGRIRYLLTMGLRTVGDAHVRSTPATSTPKQGSAAAATRAAGGLRWQAQLGILLAAGLSLGLLTSVLRFGMATDGGEVNLMRWVIWMLFAPLLLWVSLRFPLRKRVPQRLLLYAIAAGLVALSSELACQSLGGPPGGAGLSLLQSAVDDGFTIQLILSLGVIVALQAFWCAAEYRDSELRGMQLQRAIDHRRLESLRSQLEPHFLFNALNSVAALGICDPSASRQMLRRLSDLLRESLAKVNEQQIELRQELAFLQNYLGIQQARFADRLAVDFSVDPELLSHQVPSLVLQPLVENSIRHGIYGSMQQLRISVAARRHNGSIELEVADDGRGAAAPEPRQGLGLTNLRQRLQGLYGKDFALHTVAPASGGFSVRVTLPSQPYSPPV